MRSFLDIVRFELRLQCASPVFLGLCVLYFLLHLLTLSQVGIHLTDNERIAVNSPYLIVRTALVLGVLNPLPAILLVAHAIARDHERHTAEAFFSTPVSSRSFLAGRFVGGGLCAALVGAAGVAGLTAATWAPWVPDERLIPVSWATLGLTLAAVVIPNLLTYAAFSFAVVERARSITLAFIAAPGLVVLALVVNSLSAARGASEWVRLLDPSGVAAVESATRYWSVADLNSRSPFGAMALNRLVWVGLSAAVVLFTARREHLALVEGPSWTRRFSRLHARVRPWLSLRRAGPTAWPHRDIRGSQGLDRTGRATAAVRHLAPSRWSARLGPFASQVRMELRATFLSPLTVVMFALAVLATFSEARIGVSAVMGLPQHPQTGMMLGFFRYGLFQFALMLMVFYAGTLVHREREHRLADIVGALPHPDWLMVASKTAALCLAICALLVASMLTTMALQLAAGYRHFDLAVYAEGLLFGTGLYFCMLCVLAVVIQVLSPGKWVGMIATVVVFAFLLSLEALGFEDLLYGFRLPLVTYSDMNGFGHYRALVLSLAAYWVAGCVLLLAAAHLFFPRGPSMSLIARLHEARRRFSRPVATCVAVSVLAFAMTGGWIFYNTHRLNAYTTERSREASKADYERRFGQYRNQATPSLTDLDVEIELFPSERRLESRGTARLRNRRSTGIERVLVSADPRLAIGELTLTGAREESRDVSQGVILLSFAPALPPGATATLSWKATRGSRGFANSANDDEIVGNGTFVDLPSLIPLPGYDDDRELTGARERSRHGLSPGSRLAALGDPAWLNTIGRGIDGRVKMRVVVGTEADQTPVSSGRIVRTWVAGNRRHVEFVSEIDTWPTLPILSARYAVARRQAGDVAIEVYHEPAHAWNVPVMLETAATSLGYFGQEFAPYPLSSFRIGEYPRYRSAARSFPGAVAYSETAGFLTDLSGWAPLDYTTIHELAHQWWGGRAYGARMQGRQVLNETLAQYSTLMVFKQFAEPRWLREVLATTHDAYLNARSRESIDEQPLVRTEDQGNISYNKGALALFALQDLVGADRLHAALRAYLERFGMKPPPFPTSRDLVDEIRRVAGPEVQALITDLFEKIVLYDVSVDAATMRETAGGPSAASPGGYDLTIDVSGHQFVADGRGVETEQPLDTWFDVVVFPDSTEPRLAQAPLYKAKHRLGSGSQRLSVHVERRPGAVGVDPYHLMIDRTPGNNVVPVSAAVP